MDIEGCNDGATPQEQQAEANNTQEQQAEANNTQEQQTEANNTQEQQTEAQEENHNDCNDGTTPQEQQQEAQDPEDNDNEMYLFLDDESDYIETELDDNTVSTQEHHRTRNFISIRQKIEIAEAAVRGKHSPGFTLRGLAWENNLQGNQIQRYIKSLPELRRLVHKKGGNSMKHSGRPTSLANANELCEWVVNLRHEGMPISVNMVILRASQMDERFRREKMQTKYSVVRRLLRSHSIVIRSKTHQAQ